MIKYFLNEKSAQVGETVTWIVATVIIIIILGVSIFVASVPLEDNKEIGNAFYKSEDTLASKSLFSYLLTNDPEGKKIYEQLKEEENLSEFSGNFALNIFDDYYGGEYKDVWFGTVVIPVFPRYNPNDFFGKEPENVKTAAGVSFSLPYVSERIKINEGPFVTGEDNKYIELTLTNQ